MDVAECNMNVTEHIVDVAEGSSHDMYWLDLTHVVTFLQYVLVKCD